MAHVQYLKRGIPNWHNQLVCLYMFSRLLKETALHLACIESCQTSNIYIHTYIIRICVHTLLCVSLILYIYMCVSYIIFIIVRYLVIHYNNMYIYNII
jgi:hypothetical protein